MKRYLALTSIVLVTFLGLLVSFKAQTQQTGDKDSAVKNDVKTVVEGNNEFAFDLYARLKDDPKVKDKNLFFSPYSISTALAMTYAGARGETAKQMADVLNFKLPREKLPRAFGALQKTVKQAKTGDYELSIANALWGQRGFKFLEEFLTLVKDEYGGGLREVDFVSPVEREKTRKTINGWVEKQTKDKIKELIKRGNLAGAVLVLTNAIYFKGDWLIQFDKKDTKDASFMVGLEKKVQVPLMYLKENFKYWADEKLQILELPYKGKDLSMVVFLPRKSDGLAALEKQLTSENLKQWLSKLHRQKVRLYLPKFKITWGTFELGDILKAMGMTAAFGGGADFSGMTGGKDLYISNVLHKAFVAVDEEGTEAAAATAVIMKMTMSMVPAFRADHPFVFVIKDNRTDSILFAGRITNPAEKD